jgi:hypothetical protein
MSALTGPGFTYGNAPVKAETAAYVDGSPAQEWAACVAAYGLYQHQAEGLRVPSPAWWRAWRLAEHADPGLRRRFLVTGRGWSVVSMDCDPDGRFTGHPSAS